MYKIVLPFETCNSVIHLCYTSTRYSNTVAEIHSMLMLYNMSKLLVYYLKLVKFEVTQQNPCPKYN